MLLQVIISFVISAGLAIIASASYFLIRNSESVGAIISKLRLRKTTF